MPSNNTQQDPTYADPFVNNTILIININSKLKLSLLKCIFFYLLSYLYNNGDGRY